MKQIFQGRPKSSYFFIIQPPGIEVAIGENIKCINPKNNQETVALCSGKFTYEWAKIPDSFCLLNYGFNANQVKTKIEEKYPELKNTPEVRFIFLKEKK